MVVLSFMFAFIQIGLITITLAKLGLTPRLALFLLMLSFIGSTINFPLFKIRSEPPEKPVEPVFHGLLRHAQREFKGYTVIAINLGGAILPVIFSLYLLKNSQLQVIEVFLAVAVVSMICYSISRPIAGFGIGIPVLVAPLAAAIIAIVINVEYRAPLAYIAGTLGVLIGADIFRIRDVGKLGSPFASIGGAGTFDGVFLTGLIAVLLT
jgi:uncharacterized membrane protein